MPKDWAAQKENLKKFYITEDRPLEEVREILKDRYGFDASIRSYRMKIDKWNLRKYKSKKDTTDRRKSAQSRANLKVKTAASAASSAPPTTQRSFENSAVLTHDLHEQRTVDEAHTTNDHFPLNQYHSAAQTSILMESVDAFEGLFSSINPDSFQLPHSMEKRNDQMSYTQQSGPRCDTQLVDFETPASFQFMLKRWRSGKGVEDYVDHVLSKSISRVVAFQTKDIGNFSLFDLICDEVDKPERVPLIKDILHRLSEVNPQNPTAQYICWRSAYIESHWTRFKRALGLLNLNGCMSREAADLVFRATFLLVGERLIDAYRARFDMSDSLGSAISNSTFKHIQRYSESPEYFRDREQYAAMLKDFRVRCVNHWEK
ncbi:hypothetical protein ONS96_004714 [Cadophora gregata f. sp. sojae]|nr:hypothetical protein ONS96_004714 [Cadophora gregata f. sp. sojae]